MSRRDAGDSHVPLLFLQEDVAICGRRYRSREALVDVQHVSGNTNGSASGQSDVGSHSDVGQVISDTVQNGTGIRTHDQLTLFRIDGSNGQIAVKFGDGNRLGCSGRQ